MKPIRCEWTNENEQVEIAIILKFFPTEDYGTWAVIVRQDGTLQDVSLKDLKIIDNSLLAVGVR